MHNVWLPEQFVLHAKTNANYKADDVSLKPEDFDVKIHSITTVEELQGLTTPALQKKHQKIAIFALKR